MQHATIDFLQPVAPASHIQTMVAGTIVAICQFGGEFVTKDDGTLSYINGEAHAVNINCDIIYDDLKSEIASMFNIDSSNMCIKYFLPFNRRTLITVSNDKDLERMLDFNEDSLSIDIYVSNRTENRTTRSIAADSGTSIVDTAAAERKCRSRRPTTTNMVSTRTLRPRVSVTDSSAPKTAIGKRGRTSVADLSIKTVTGKTSENAKQKRLAAAETTVIRIVVDDSVAPTAIVPPVDTNIPERLTLNSTDEANEANPHMGVSLDIADDIGSQHSTNHGDTVISEVGQEFENVRAFRDDLCKYAFAKGFALKYVKNEKVRVTAKCSSENCPWRVHASRSTRKQTFIVKKFNNVHTCGARASEDLHLRARKLWLAGTIRKIVLANPECKPRDIARAIYEEFGVNLSYLQAWSSREAAQKEIRMLQEEACNQLPWLCEQIMGANLGSVATVATSVDAKFRRCFVAFYASLHGFEHGCRPLMFLDRIRLKVNNYWKLLVAASIDGENEIFPVAFAMVEEETPDCWHWFLLQLKYAVTSQKITIVSSTEMGLDELVPQIFEDCYHGYSLFHLIENFKAVLKKGPWSDQQKGTLVDYLKGAARAYLVDDFNAYIGKINDISKEVGKWVMSSKPDSWSNALFGGRRYGHLSSEVINSLSDWITMKDESSAVQIMNALLVKMMHMIQSRQQASSTWEDTLTPFTEKIMQKEVYRARSLNVIRSTETVFEVRCSTVNVVDIGNWECTCRRWQIIGLPCMHAIAVFERIGRSFYDYCPKYFRRESYVATYSTPIRPIPDINLMKFVIPSSPYPPPRNRLSERPRRKRINPHKTSIRQLRCSRCKLVGHNKATCDVQL